MTGFRRSSARPTRRTLPSFVVRALVPRAVLFGVVAVVVGVGQAMGGSPSASSSSLPADEVATRPPAWTLADVSAFPGCVPSAAWPAGKVAPFVVVRGVNDEVRRRVAFDLAWRVNHDHLAANDVWVVGVCG